MGGGEVDGGRDQGGGTWLLGVLVLDAVMLAAVELFFLPLRFDGVLLPKLGSLPFPATALLAVVSTPWLVLRAAELSPRLTVAGAPFAAWLATFAVLVLAGPDGAMLLLPDVRTVLLLAGGVLPTAVVLGRAVGRAHHVERSAGSEDAAGERRD